jgi:hypothetical protein
MSPPILATSASATGQMGPPGHDGLGSSCVAEQSCLDRLADRGKRSPARRGSRWGRRSAHLVANRRRSRSYARWVAGASALAA